MQFLINQGVDINLTDKKGVSALMRAIKMSNESVIEVLCKNNADVNIQNQMKWSPLHEAIKKEKED